MSKPVLSVNVEMDKATEDMLKDLTVFEKGPAKKALVAIAGKYMLEQRENIKKGIDADGRPFAEYSVKYADNKRRAGRAPAENWLRLSGQMLQSQKTAIKTAGGKKNWIMMAVVSFEGSRPQVNFKSRSIKSRNPRKRIRSKVNDLVVSRSTSKTVLNQTLATANDKRRSFIGLSSKKVTEFVKYFLKKYLGSSRKK